MQPTTRARRWIAFAIACLVLAGFHAVALVVGRMPPFDRLVGADPALFRRCLVVHVDLSLVAWFQAFLAGLLALMGARAREGWLGRAALPLGVAGVVALCLAAQWPGAEPVLSNYVPAIDHPVFVAGISLLAMGLAANALSALRAAGAGPGPERSPLVPAGARAFLVGAAVALLVACVTFGAAAWTLPAGVSAAERWELIAWGGGHVLQFASVAAMLACWVLLVGSLVGREVLGRRAATVLAAWLVAPVLVAPILAAHGSGTWEYRVGATLLMRWGTWPPVVVVLIVLARAAWSARARRGGVARLLSDPRAAGFVASGALTVVGFGLGAAIRGSNTMVPAHYHASIGAVTVAFMATTWWLLEPLGLRKPTSRRVRRLTTAQPTLFGAGQLVFAVGFAFAGAHGTARKAYGAEQAARTLPETVGLVVMGLGGLVAVAAGVAFLVLAALAWRDRLPRLAGRPLTAPRADGGALPDLRRLTP